MSEANSLYSQKVGLPPGALVYIGKKKKAKVTISEIDYSDGLFEESSIEDIDSSKHWKDDQFISWIDVNGVHDTELLGKLGKQLMLDELVMEDIVNTGQRPKCEELDNYLFVIIKGIKVVGKEKITKEQVSFLLNDKGLISFQESGCNYFKVIKERIVKRKGAITKRKSDFLLYRLLDTLVDDYFIITEFLDDRMMSLEKKILESPDDLVHQEIYELKAKISKVKKGMVPIRETISGIMKSDMGLIHDANKKYFQDIYEHVVQIIETLDSQRETINDFLNLYMSAMSNKMNEVMKVLTIFATIFIPLTFIAGIYGMNFDIMPELHWKYGYLITWGVMIAVALALLNYFRRKKWL